MKIKKHNLTELTNKKQFLFVETNSCSALCIVSRWLLVGILGKEFERKTKVSRKTVLKRENKKV